MPCRPRPSRTRKATKSCWRVVQARDAEVGVLKLMIEKLKVQLARRNRNDFGSTSERFEGLQGSLLETATTG